MVVDELMLLGMYVGTPIFIWYVRASARRVL